MRSLLVIALGLAPLVMLGCRPKCNPDTDKPHCESSVLMTCPQPGVDQLVGANEWVSSDCASKQQVCVEASGTALCALSASPSAHCPDGGAEACDGNVHVYCSQGFETSRFTCLTCSATTDGGPVTCAGGPGSPCTHDSDCASPMVCSSGFCAGKS
jgi:hypothetical protein